MASNLGFARTVLSVLAAASIATPALSVGPDRAPNHAAADDVVLLKASGPGVLFLGGNFIDGPWTLAYDHGRFAVNGLALRPPSPRPPALPPSAARRARIEFLNAAGVLADSLARSRLDLAVRQKRLTLFVDSNNLGAKASGHGSSVTIRFPDGLDMSFDLEPHGRSGQPPGPSDRPVSERENRIGRLELLKRPLENGDVVFIVDRVTMVVWPRARKGEVMAAIEQLRRGGELDSLDLHLLSRAVRGPLVKPTALDSIW